MRDPNASSKTKGLSTWLLTQKKKNKNKNHVEPQLTTFTNSSLCDVRVGSYFRQQSCQNKKTSDSLEVSQV